MAKTPKSKNPYDIEAWMVRECSTLRAFPMHHWCVNRIEGVCAEVGIKDPGQYAKRKVWERDCAVIFIRERSGRLKRIISCSEVVFVLNGHNIIVDAYLP